MEEYKILTEETAISYVLEKTDIFSHTDILIAKEFSGERQSVDGYCNTLMLVKSTTSDRSVVIKQVLPFVRALKEKGLLLSVSLKRLNAEVYYTRLLNKVIPYSVPNIYLWNREDSILIMEDLSKMSILRNELINMEKFPKLPSQLGAFLGKSAFYTSQLFLSSHEKNTLESLFSSWNTGSVFEDLIFNYSISDDKIHTIYYKLQDDIDEFYGNTKIVNEIKELKGIFVNDNQCLIHTDLHSSNIFVDYENMKVFDSEFARYGPISFDLGRLIGNIILNYASLTGMKDISEEKRNDYQNYLLEIIRETYYEFEKSFSKLADRHHKIPLQSKPDYLTSMLADTVGFAACVSVSRLFDNGLSFDFKRIGDLDERTRGQRFVIKLARNLLTKRKMFNSIDDLVREIKELTLRYIVRDLIEETYSQRVNTY